MAAPPALIDEIRPSAQMVADLVRTRLVEELGAMQGIGDGASGTPVDTFTPDTYPTDTQAERMIDQACLAILGQLPGSIVEDTVTAATHVTALYAAILIEGSYFREQLTDDQVQLYWELLKSGVRGIQATGGGTAAFMGGPVDSVIQRSVMTDPYELVIQMGMPSLD